MSTSPMTLTETVESLNGFEEIAIETNFGADIETLLETKATKAYRALVAVTLARGGANAKEAKKQAMSLTIKEATNYFAKDEEVNEEDPVTDSGKGDSSPEGEPTSSQSSA